jgi:hypothetical protein
MGSVLRVKNSVPHLLPSVYAWSLSESGVERKDAMAQRREGKKFKAGQETTHSWVTQRLRSHAPYFLAALRLCAFAFCFERLAMAEGGTLAGIDRNQPGVLHEYALPPAGAGLIGLEKPDERP